MWRIYVILALWARTSHSQYGGSHMANSRGGTGEWGREGSTLTITNNSEYYNNTIINLAQLPHRAYNKNSRDSFRYTDTLLSNRLLSSEKESLNKMPHANESAIAEKSLLQLKINSTTRTTQPPTVSKIQTSSSFDARLFNIVSQKAQHENLVYSTISLQTIMSFIFTISDGKLYDELSQLLAISDSPAHVAKDFEKILRKFSVDAQSTVLIMANKLYYNHRYGPVDRSVSNIAENSFGCELERVNFFESSKVANTINSWVRNKTRNLIKEIVTTSSISGETSALLINSMYFKSEWLAKFSPDDTEKQEFFLSQHVKVPVDMMYNEDVFRYGIFTDLQASIVELRYKRLNLSMLLILPFDIEGLPNLERKLNHYDINLISERLKREIVTVKIPRFRVEYETDMITVLKEMGLHALFSNDGTINLFKNLTEPFRVDGFQHKSSINVNEAGTEAAAATVAKYVPLSLPTDMKYFVADHPFIFVIRDTNTTFFMGHVVTF